MAASSAAGRAARSAAVKTLSCERMNIWLMITPEIAPKGLNDWAKFRRCVAVDSGPMANT